MRFVILTMFALSAAIISTLAHAQDEKLGGQVGESPTLIFGGIQPQLILLSVRLDLIPDVTGQIGPVTGGLTVKV